MSPTKARPLTRRAAAAAAAAAASSIPRRVVRDPKKLQKTLGVKKNAILKNGENVALSPPKNITVAPYDDASDKENMPVVRGTVHAGSSASPTRTRGVSKLTAKKPSVKRRSNRIPLRELTSQEVFERDEAALGDLRRRRSGEGYSVEIDSIPAQPSPITTNALRAAGLISPSAATAVFTIPEEASEQLEEVPKKGKGKAKTEKIKVLRTSPRMAQTEELQRKVDSILAATSTAAALRPRRILRSHVSPSKSSHPAVKATPTLQDSPTLQSLSPLKIRHSPSPIAKASPSPARPLRMGLGLKSGNILLTAVVEKKKKVENGEGEKKRVIVTSSTAKEEVTTKRVTRKKAAAGNSLKRAAGGVRATGGLEGIRRMR